MGNYNIPCDHRDGHDRGDKKIIEHQRISLLERNVTIDNLVEKLDKLEHRFEDEQIKSCHLQYALKDFPFYKETQYSIMHKLENIEH